MSKRYIIVGGHFSRNGNFIGITSNNEKIHIYEIQMSLLNLKSIHDVTLPLFALGTIKTFPELTGESGDTERKPIIKENGENKTFERLTAKVVYSSFDSLINAVYASEIALNETLIENLRIVAEDAGVPLDSDYINPYLDIIKENNIEAENAFKEFFQYKISTNKKNNSNVTD